jgi:8-oxo-dGTP diphosphatase
VSDAGDAPAVPTAATAPTAAVEVRAAGGIVVRPGARGPEVLVVHRPRYDDWSFPKGKQDPGETDEETALREVAEETGLRCTLGAYLDEVRYRDHRGRAKLVRYWQMDPPGADPPPFEPGDEVDALVWCSVGRAATLLSYDHDRGLLARLEG